MAIRTHSIKDAGAPFEVDPFTRKVTVPNTERVIGVVGDHLSEQVSFRVPNVIDGHSMPKCTRKYIAWRNVEGEPGTDDLKLTEEAADYSIYVWTVRDALTVAKGLVAFSLRFECDDPTTGEQIYSWGTHTCEACEILDSVNARLGAYAAIYINGESLVFADYNPVHDEKLDLASCVVPEGTIELNAEGVHDVGRYAYADVKGVYETPTIEIVDGVVTASANGLEAAHPLSAPVIEQAAGKITATANGLTTTLPVDVGALAKTTKLHFTNPGMIISLYYQAIQADGTIKQLFIGVGDEKPEELEVVAGGYVEISVVLGSVTVPAYSTAVVGTINRTTSGAANTLVRVPIVPADTTVEISIG